MRLPAMVRWVLRLGPANPVTVRLVFSGSRRQRHLYIRAAYLAALILALLWTLLGTTGGTTLSYSQLARAGAASFTWVAYLQILLICVLTPVFMAGAIAQEANPRTWDILLTTPLSSAQIVLGNLLGRLFFVLALLVASLPLFALTQYFGGVPGRSILASYAIAGSAAILVGAIAIALSTSRLAGIRAVFAFYVAVVSYVGLTWAIDVWARTAGLGAAGGRGVTYMTAINPFLALRALLNPSGYPTALASSREGYAAWALESPVMTWCVGSLALAALLVGFSTVTLRLGGLAGVGGGRSGVPWIRRLSRLGPAGEEHRAPRAVWNNPVAWREGAARNATLGRIIARWAFIGLGVLFGLGLIVAHNVGRLGADTFRLALAATVWTEFAVTALVAINVSASAVTREREDGTLDLLTTTPITPAQYIGGKLRGIVTYLLPMLAVPVLTLLAAGVYVLGDGFGAPGGAHVVVTTGTWTGSAPIALPEGGILMTIVGVPFIAFCVMVGLRLSVRSRGSISAVVSSVGVAGVVSGILGLCGWNAAEAIEALGPVLGASTPPTIIRCAVYPADAMRATVTSAPEGLAAARMAIMLGACIAAAAYAAVVYALHAQTVKNFDMDVRRLAGAR
jgi:ABC-type transport system involved in multi-copper enzyme maturation permease subunit